MNEYMSPNTCVAQDKPSPDVVQPETAKPVEEPPRYSMSGGLVALLARLNLSVAFTSYQSGILYLLGHDDRGAHLHQTGILRPMGLARDGEAGFILASGLRLVRFANPLAAGERATAE